MMSPERIEELRKQNTWAIEECLDEIGRLQSEREAMFATCDELRGLEARETARVLALTTELATVRQTHAPETKFDPNFSGYARCAKCGEGHATNWDCGSCTIDPERCSSTWKGIDGNDEFSCSKDAYHDGPHTRLVDGELAQGWYDDASGTKPHVQAAGPAEVNDRLVAELKAARQEIQSADCGRDAALEMAASAAKERDEARAKGEAMWNQRAAVIQALGVGEDIDMGLDIVDAARSLRDMHDVAVDEGVVLRTENERLKSELDAQKRQNEKLYEDLAQAQQEPSGRVVHELTKEIDRLKYQMHADIHQHVVAERYLRMNLEFIKAEMLRLVSSHFEIDQSRSELLEVAGNAVAFINYMGAPQLADRLRRVIKSFEVTGMKKT